MNQQKDPCTEYVRRSKLYEDTIMCKKVDHVLASPQTAILPIALYGMTTVADVMADYRNYLPSLIQYHKDYDADLYWAPESFFPSPALDILGCTYIRRPGKEIADPNACFQILDKEDGYMSGEEYLEYAEDPTGFIMRKVLPRHYEGLKGLEMVNLSNSVYQGGLYSMIPFGLEPVQNTLLKMMEAGKKMMAFAQHGAEVAKAMFDLGYPCADDAFVTVPFDLFNDTLRGLLNTTMDMLEYPDELLEALKTSTRLQVQEIRNKCKQNPNVKTFVFFVHNGTDLFMSEEQFKTFYWPGLKACVDEIVSQGCTPHIYLEDKYDAKMHILAEELPAGKCIVTPNKCDLERTKELFAGKICISGGVDGTLLEYGTPEQVTENVKRAIDILAPGGGYFLNTDVSLDCAKPENLRAMFDTARNYMKY